MKIINYNILIDSLNASLSEKVENFIQQGWQPYGNPYVDKGGTEKQAMVVYEIPLPEGDKPATAGQTTKTIL